MINPLFISKYSPSTLDDFFVREDIKQTLTMFLKYDIFTVLLYGDQSTGKTSLVHTIIKDYFKGIPFDIYSKNVMFINPLKEQGIGYYRNDVKTFCSTYSTISDKKKIVVIDDIDNITEQNQQVFQHCVDQYEHNVFFIATCSNIECVSDGLQSRLVPIHLNRVTNHDMCCLIRRIATTENIDMDETCVLFLAEISNYSVKTIINYMEKLFLFDSHITVPIICELCTNINYTVFETYTEHILYGRLSDAIDCIMSIYHKGYSVLDIFDTYFTFIKHTKQLTDKEKYELVPLVCKYIQHFYSLHEHEVELSLFTNNAIQKITRS